MPKRTITTHSPRTTTKPSIKTTTNRTTTTNNRTKKTPPFTSATPFYWKKELNLLLIELYANVRYKQKQVWNIIFGEICETMVQNEMDEFPNCKQRKMVKQFKKTVDHNNKTGWDQKTCNFHEESSKIRKPNIVPEITINSSGLGNTKKRQSEESSGDESDESDDENDQTKKSNNQQQPQSHQQQKVQKKKRKYEPSEATKSILLWLESYRKRKLKERKRELQRQKREDERYDQKMHFYKRLLDKF